MKISKTQDKIIIADCNDFNVEETLECGQIFSYNKINDNSYLVISKNKLATITYSKTQIIIESNDTDYFYNFFDLDTDYSNIKKELVKINPNISKYLGYGSGIRILKQDIYQTIISFIVSANNNIKRIKNILFTLSKQYGTKIAEDIYSFPTLQQLAKVSAQDYAKLGAGYRSEYLEKTVKMLLSSDYDIDYLKSLSTPNLKQKLLTLMGIGPKVADCIMLFSFSRTDVFPIDTWTRKSYYLFETKPLNDKQIANYYVNIYKNYSGYAQQYLYNYMLNHSRTEEK